MYRHVITYVAEVIDYTLLDDFPGLRKKNDTCRDHRATQVPVHYCYLPDDIYFCWATKTPDMIINVSN